MAFALPLSRIGESVDESDSNDRLRKVEERVPVRSLRQEPPPRATSGPEPCAVRPRQGQCRTGELYRGQATRNVGGARCAKEFALSRGGGVLVLLVKVIVGLRMAADAVQS